MIMYVQVAITLKDDADALAVFENMDYSFTDPEILDTELGDVTVVDNEIIRRIKESYNPLDI